MNKRKWEMWKRVRDWCERRMAAAWREGGGCDSCCPQCKRWESKGNIIRVYPRPDGSESRFCRNCGHSWRAIFTPGGFLPIPELPPAVPRCGPFGESPSDNEVPF